jgi:SAM-dependent methyltransferase
MTVANAEQHAAWNGESGQRWVAGADRRDLVLAPIGDLLLDAAAIHDGDRVLDVGCGCGATTLAAGRAAGVDGRAVGLDLSAPLLELARRRAVDRGCGAEFVQADVQTDPLGGPFDVAISRFGTMFFDDPAAAFANVARHLVPGGRLVMVTWQPLTANEWLVVPGAALLHYGELPAASDSSGPGMFAQSDPVAIRAVLTAAGFIDIAIDAHVLPLVYGPTVDDALYYLADSGPGRAILETVPPDRHDDALAAVRLALGPHVDPDVGVVLDAAVLVTTGSVTNAARATLSPR